MTKEEQIELIKKEIKALEDYYNRTMKDIKFRLDLILSSN